MCFKVEMSVWWSCWTSELWQKVSTGLSCIFAFKQYIKKSKYSTALFSAVTWRLSSHWTWLKVLSHFALLYRTVCWRDCFACKASFPLHPLNLKLIISYAAFWVLISFMNICTPKPVRPPEAGSRLTALWFRGKLLFFIVSLGPSLSRTGSPLNVVTNSECEKTSWGASHASGWALLAYGAENLAQPGSVFHFHPSLGLYCVSTVTAHHKTHAWPLQKSSVLCLRNVSVMWSHVKNQTETKQKVSNLFEKGHIGAFRVTLNASDGSFLQSKWERARCTGPWANNLIMNAWSEASECGQLVAGQLFPCPFLLSSFLMKSDCFWLAKLCVADRNWITVER